MLQWFIASPDPIYATTFLGDFLPPPWLLVAANGHTVVAVQQCATDQQAAQFIRKHHKQTIRVALADVKSGAEIFQDRLPHFTVSRYAALAIADTPLNMHKVQTALPPSVWLRHLGDPKKKIPRQLVAAWRFDKKFELPGFLAARKAVTEFAARLGIQHVKPLPDLMPLPFLSGWKREDLLYDRDTRLPVLEAAGKKGVVVAQGNGGNVSGPKSLDDYEEEAIEWLWPNVFPFGKLSLLGGLPGVGKSQLLISIASALSKGGPLPDGSMAARGRSLILASEDDAKDTIKPRVRAAGGLPSMIYPIEECFNFSEPGGLDQFFAVANAIPDLRAVFFDPIDRYAEGNGATVRRALTQLIGWAGRKKIALIGILHPPKNANEVNIQNLFGGSSAFMRVARSAWISLPDRDDRREFPRVFFLFAKSNIIGDKRGYVYETKAKTLPSGIDTVYVEWKPERLNFTGEQYLANGTFTTDGLGAPEEGTSVNSLTREYGQAIPEAPRKKYTATEMRYIEFLRTILPPLEDGGIPIEGPRIRRMARDIGLNNHDALFYACDELNIERRRRDGAPITEPDLWVPPSQYPAQLSR